MKNRLSKLAHKGWKRLQSRRGVGKGTRPPIPTNHNSPWVNRKQIEAIQVVQQAKEALADAEKALEDILTD